MALRLAVLPGGLKGRRQAIGFPQERAGAGSLKERHGARELFPRSDRIARIGGPSGCLQAGDGLVRL